MTKKQGKALKMEGEQKGEEGEVEGTGIGLKLLTLKGGKNEEKLEGSKRTRLISRVCLFEI